MSKISPSLLVSVIEPIALLHILPILYFTVDFFIGSPIVDGHAFRNDLVTPTYRVL